MTNVFISHSTKDRSTVESQIINPLQKSGIDTWYSKDIIRGGQDWHDKIIQGLERCEWFLVALSGHAVESEWVKSEVRWAISNRKDRFIPVVLASCDRSRIDLRLSGI
jgi:hypothetical protein